MTASERYLARLARTTFLSLWSYPNVYRDESRTKTNGARQEVCDLLVVFGNHVLIFSDKDCEFTDTGDLSVDWPRWFRKAVRDGARQVRGAEGWIAGHPDNIFVDNLCTKPLPISLPTRESAVFHRIVVAHGASKRCQRELGGSGSLMVLPAAKGDEHPFTIGRVDHSPGYVHVLDDTTLPLVLDTLNTITDFVTYLEKKESVIERGTVVSAAGEEELVAYYVTRMNDRGEHDFVVPPGTTTMGLLEGHWQALESNPRRLAQVAEDRVSYVWDGLIEDLNRNAIEGAVEYQSHPGLESHEQVVRVMAAEHRTKRRMLGRALWDMILTTPATVRATRTMAPTQPGEPAYVFFLTPDYPGLSYAQNRELRRWLLQDYCLVAKLELEARRLGPRADRIIGIASESGQGNARSWDAMYVGVEDWTPELHRMAEESREFLRRNGLVADRRIYETNAKQYPDVLPPGRTPGVSGT